MFTIIPKRVQKLWWRWLAASIKLRYAASIVSLALSSSWQVTQAHTDEESGSSYSSNTSSFFTHNWNFYYKFPPQGQISKPLRFQFDAKSLLGFCKPTNVVWIQTRHRFVRSSIWYLKKQQNRHRENQPVWRFLCEQDRRKIPPVTKFS